MRLGSMFGGQKTLAKVVTTPKPKEVDPSLPMPPAMAKAIGLGKRKPGDFGVVWPAKPTQKVKDYQPILTREDLELYVQRCADTGYCSFDWETTASKQAREEFKAYSHNMQERIADLKSQAYGHRVQMVLDDGCENTPEIIKLDIDIRMSAPSKKKMDSPEALELEGEARILEAQLATAREVFLKTPLDPHMGEICTVSLSASPHEARVVPIQAAGRCFEPGLGTDEARKMVLDILDRMIFRNTKIMKIAVNLSFESKFAAKYGKYILMPVADPFVMWVRCLQVAAPGRLYDLKRPAKDWGLKPATKDIFGVIMGDFTKLLAHHGVDFFDEIPADSGDGLVYSAEDADYGLQHYLYWIEVAKQIKDERQGTNYYDWLHKIEMPFGRVIGLMEYNGMAWDNNLAQMKREEAWAIQSAAGDEIRDICMTLFNLDVNPGKTGKTGAVKHVLFNLMNLPQGKATDKGNISLDEEALIDMKFMLENNLVDLSEEKLLAIELPGEWDTMNVPPEETAGTQEYLEGPTMKAVEYAKFYSVWQGLSKDEKAAVRLKRREPHPYKDAGLRLLELMGTIQKMGTLLSSHVDGREKWQNPVSKKIHANYTPWTDTSRLNSSHPNGQNVPRLENDELGVRNFYVASPGKILFFIDFAGFELRILAWKSGDEVMIEIFNTGGDMHTKTAAAITGKTEAEVLKKERTDAKPANFGMAYGGTEHALQKTIKTDYGQRKTLDECLVMVNGTKKAYPGVPVFQQEVAMQAREDGFVSTMYGYIRLLPDINSTNKYNRNSAGRQAANTPIQGTAADVMKRSQNDVYEETGLGTNARYDFYELCPLDPDSLEYDEHEKELQQQYPLYHGGTDLEAQIHDEMIFEMNDDPDVVEAAWHWIQKTMEKPPIDGFPVPILAEASVGYRWGEKMPVQQWLNEKRGVAK